MPATDTSKKRPGAPKAAKVRLTVAEVMAELEAAGSEQTRKTYSRHGAVGPMFGVSFSLLKTLTKRIGVDHDLALALWDTGNFDAQNLAVKIVDPARMAPDHLDRWVHEGSPSRMSGGYFAMIASEGPHGPAKASEWLGAEDVPVRCAGWTLLGQLALRDETVPDSLFEERLAVIERGIHSAPNAERDVMNQVVIAIGSRSAGLREAALAAAKRIGKVQVDHGDTACKTSDAAEYIDKAWVHSTLKGFESPAAQERTREVPRRRC